MSAPCWKGYCYEERHVKAGKRHQCAWCYGVIEKGAEHVVVTEFPGDEAGFADLAGHPVRMRMCATPPCHYRGEPVA